MNQDMQLIVVGVVVATAIAYLIRATLKQFLGKSSGCSSGCGKCTSAESPPAVPGRISLPQLFNIE